MFSSHAAAEPGMLCEALCCAKLSKTLLYSVRPGSTPDARILSSHRMAPSLSPRSPQWQAASAKAFGSPLSRIACSEGSTAALRCLARRGGVLYVLGLAPPVFLARRWAPSLLQLRRRSSICSPQRANAASSPARVKQSMAACIVRLRVRLSSTPPRSNRRSSHASVCLQSPVTAWLRAMAAYARPSGLKPASDIAWNHFSARAGSPRCAQQSSILL
mmetsp:Transcript_17294/g.47737  ORF Transcript_17294/g.47737 Transcript_17294/m.47737 type:complete len:217 (+) Transcript_17294:915-1565(+)